jgi:outer membrane lipoprotein SlyB
MHPSESFTYLSDFQLSRIMGGSNQPKDYSIDLKSLGSEMASGAVLGGLGAAAATGGPGWPVGAVGGAIGGGIYWLFAESCG